MPEYNAGDAKLRIIPDASAFKRELETKLDAIKVNFNVRVGVEMAQARADMVRFRSEEQNKAVGQRVAPQFSRANAEMAAWRAEQRVNAVNVPVNADTSQARSAVKSLTNDATSGFSKLSGEVSKALGGLLSIGKTVGLTALVANIPAAVTGVVSLTQAIQQLSGAALVVPGAIATAGASIGTLAVGLSGVSDAYTAVTAASEAAGTGQAAQAAAAASATASLRNAVVDEAQAQKDVATARKDARQELQDLNLEMRGGVISEKQAINDAAKARRDLAKGGFKDSLDRADALLRVEAADQRVAESHARTLEIANKKNEADAKGVEGSDLVVAANERLTRSHQSVESAQASLAAAATTASAASQKADAAMAKLAPNAREFVQTLIDLKPRWQDLKTTVQGNLFEGASTSFTQFVDNVLPNLKTGMGSIATAWNTNIKTLLKSLGNDSSKGLLDRILGNTTTAQNNFNKAIDPLVKGIGTLTAAGSDAIPRLATAIGSVAERFSTFITAADKDGRLAGWIDKGLTGFTDLGNILLNIGKSFVSVNDALGGQGMLATLKDLTDRMAGFLGSAEGQNKLKAFFQEGREEIDRLKPIVSNLIAILPDVWRSAKDAADLFMPVLMNITQILRDTPGLVTLIGDAFLAWKAVEGANNLTKSLRNITDILKITMPKAAAEGAVAIGSSFAGIIWPAALLALIGPVALGAGNQVAAGTNTTRSRVPLLKPDGNVDPTGTPQPLDKKPPVQGTGTPLTASAWAQQAPNAADRRKRLAWNHEHVNYEDLDNPGFVPPNSYEKGGPTEAGLAVLHPKEYVLSARADKYPMAFKDKLNRGLIDPKALPHFETGGPWPDPMSDNGQYPPTTGGQLTGSSGDILGPVGPAPGGGGLLPALSSALDGLGSTSLFAPGGPLGGQPGATPFTPGIAPIPGSGVAPTGDIAPPVLPVPGGVNQRHPLGVGLPPKHAPTGTSSSPGVTGAAPGPANTHLGSGAQPGPEGPSFQLGDDPLAPAPGAPDLGNNPLLQVWQNPDGSAMPLDQILSGLPDKLKPENIANQFGQIALGFVTGFFGLDTTYLSAAGQALGFAQDKLSGQGGASVDLSAATTDPAVQQALASGDTSGLSGGVPTGNASTANVSTFLKSMAGRRYISGGQSPEGTDCSGYVSMAVKSLLGQNPFSGDRMTTRNAAQWISGKGGQLGVGPPGTLRIGWYNHGPNAQDGHMAGTLPDGTNFESGGGGPIKFGGPAKGADSSQFDMHAYFQVPGSFIPPVVVPDATGAPVPTGVTPSAAANPSGSSSSNLYKLWYGSGSGGGSTDPAIQSALATVKALPKSGSESGVDNTDYRKTYDIGGILAPGVTLAHNNTGKNELVLTHEQASMLPHFAEGGDYLKKQREQRAAPKPLPRPPDVQRKIPPSIPMQPRIAAPTPRPTAPPAPQPQAPEPSAPEQFAPPPQSAESAPAPGAVTGPAGENQAGEDGHLLPAVGKAITSGAAAIGSAVDTAVAAATFGATAGMGGGMAAMGGAGGGGGGLSIGGVIQQGGKIVKDAAEVAASFLVGNVTGGTIEGDAYGETYKPQQKLPQTSPLNPRDGYGPSAGGGVGGNNYVFNGIDGRNVVDEIRLKDKQDSQAVLARW